MTRGVRMHHPMRPGRLTILIAGLLAVTHGACVLIAFVWMAQYSIWVKRYQYPPANMWRDVALTVVWPYVPLPGGDLDPSSIAWFLAILGCWGLVVPGMFCLLPQALRMRRVRAAHFARMGCYGYVGVVSILFAVALATLGVMTVAAVTVTWLR